MLLLYEKNRDAWLRWFEIPDAAESTADNHYGPRKNNTWLQMVTGDTYINKCNTNEAGSKI